MDDPEHLMRSTKMLYELSYYTTLEPRKLLIHKAMTMDAWNRVLKDVTGANANKANKDIGIDEKELETNMKELN